jgi:hemin uptake protein HemP
MSISRSAPLSATASQTVSAPDAQPRAPAGLPARKRLSSHALLGGEREIEIEHAGQLYRLRLTSLGKLILTK